MRDFFEMARQTLRRSEVNLKIKANESFEFILALQNIEIPRQVCEKNRDWDTRITN